MFAILNKNKKCKKVDKVRYIIQLSMQKAFSTPMSEANRAGKINLKHFCAFSYDRVGFYFNNL